MITTTQHTVRFTLLIALGFGLSGCQTDKHAMVEARPGMTVVCKNCYDQTVTMRHPTGSRTGANLEQMHTTHHCSSCNTDMTTYVEGGVAKIKCAKCAPEGLACDKCLPAGSYSARMQ